MDVDKLIQDLKKLKKNNPAKFKKRLESLKEKTPGVYKKVVMALTPKGYEKYDESGESESTPVLSYVIIAVIILGILLTGLILFFLGEVSLQPEDINATESLTLGLSLFNNESDNYLQYSFTKNISGVKVTYITGREYYYLNKGDYSSIKYSDTYNCSDVNCELVTPQEYTFSQREGNTLYYDSREDCDIITNYNERVDSIMEYYKELYYFYENGYVIESEREEIGSIKDVECAPMYFKVNPPSDYLNEDEDLIELRYELCLDNNGVPLALGVFLNTDKRIEIFISYMQSTSSELVKETMIQGKEFQNWVSEGLTC